MRFLLFEQFPNDLNDPPNYTKPHEILLVTIRVISSIGSKATLQLEQAPLKLRNLPVYACRFDPKFCIRNWKFGL
jgi:hypothetical protein